MIDPLIAEKVNAQIDRIRPVIDAHGGGVEILVADQSQILLRLRGHCAGCPLAPMTFGVVLYKYLLEALPEVKQINYTL